ncbi:MAG TPA: tRNA pseudouridine(55) synthase TruB, partial [Steroidobacteraceae bacterium]|nr:tRNA pseudouridine(55) synthase TruB [Steroidobacteraceae bacterium]
MQSGILLLDKPLGLSSNAALQRVRRTLGVEKAGHVGSLDPLATGMLPICLGEATKIAGDVLSGRKCYRFTIGLGARTATGDTEGAVVETAAIPTLEPATIEAVRQRFLGQQTQVPPMYSALKRDGQPLYKLARAGIEVERAAREIVLFDLQVQGFTADRIELETVCSKGTYIRVLAEDLAKALGTCGHVTLLRRLHVEPFEAQPMETLESVAQAREQGRWPRVLPADWPLGHLPKVMLAAAEVTRLMHGQSVSIAGNATNAGVGAADRVRLYDDAGQFLGIGASDGHGTVRPRRLFTGLQGPPIAGPLQR